MDTSLGGERYSLELYYFSLDKGLMAVAVHGVTVDRVDEKSPAASLNHPNIAAVYGFEEGRGPRDQLHGRCGADPARWKGLPHVCDSRATPERPGLPVRMSKRCGIVTAQRQSTSQILCTGAQARPDIIRAGP